MTVYLNDRVLDNGLTVLDTEATRLDITETLPTTYAEATSTYTIGNKEAISIGAPEDRTPNGRKVVVAAITGGSVTSNGTATYWAVSDSANSRLLAQGELSATQVVTSGNTFSLAAFDIGIPDATS